MELVSCGKGHFYDQNLGECPFCAAEKAAGKKSGNWFNLSKQNVGDENGKTRKDENNSVDDIGPTVSKGHVGKNIEDCPGPAGFDPVAPVFDPIVGWLVCVKGPSKGQDYHLRSGNNRIGRSSKNDIVLQGDITISADGGAKVGFDSRSGHFYFAAGMGKNISYVNNQAVYNFVELHAYDVITVGNTDLMFVPLCGEHFNWNQ